MRIRANRLAGSLLAGLSILVLIGGLVLPGQAAAAGNLSRRVVFNISAQPMSSALARFADQVGVQFTAPSSLISSLRTRGVHGQYSPAEALTKLLEDTGLGYRILDAHTIVIISRKGSRGASARMRVRSHSSGTAHRDPSPRLITNRKQLAAIIVTAEKRVENVQTVPIAMNVIQGSDLASRGIQSADDIAKFLPNISMQSQSSFASGITIRGVGSSDIHPNAEQSVGQYFDGVSVPTPYASQLALFDIQRIEVLRGPQNALFGQNTTGGAIRYISRTPRVGASSNGYARVTAGNYSDIQFTGAYGFPLGPTMAARLAVSVQHRRGIFNDLNNGERYDSISRQAGRASFKWKPDNATTLLVIAHVAASTGAPGPLRAVGTTLADGTTPCPAIGTGTNAYIGLNDCFQKSRFGTLTNLSTAKWTDVYGVEPPIGRVHDAGAVIRLTHRYRDGIRLTSITGLERTTVQVAVPLSGTPFLQFRGDDDTKYDFGSQEFRLTSAPDKRLTWLAGVYASYEYDDLGNIVEDNSAGPPSAGPPSAPPIVLSTELKQFDRLASIYAQLDYKLTRRLTASIAGRFSYNDRSGVVTPRMFNFTQDGTMQGAQLAPGTFLTLPFARSIVAGVTTPCTLGVRLCNGPGLKQGAITRLPGWNISLKYQFNPEIMGYLSDARGFKVGSGDMRAVAIFLGTAKTPVKPEKLDAYQVGVKSTLLGGRLRVNADVFHYRWLDEQVFSAAQHTGPAFLNIPLGSINGAELSVNALLPDRWTFRGGVGYLHGWISDSGGLVGVKDGAPLSNAPRFTGDATVGKGFDLGRFGLLQFSASARYRGRENSSLNDNIGSVVSSVAFLDLSGRYVFGPTGQYSLVALAQNVTSAKTCGSSTFLLQTGTYRCAAPNPGVPLYSLSFQVNFGESNQ